MERLKLKRAAIFPSFKTKTVKQIKYLQKKLSAKKIEISLPQELAKHFKLNHLGLSEAQLIKQCQIIISLGGDGTFLRAARMVCGNNIPVLGINLGGLGFLTEISLNNLDSSLNKVISGNYSIEKRIMLDCEVFRNKKKIFKSAALNDVVIYRGAHPRLLNLKTFINERYIASFQADGLIISTPTGSTAYSLAAGGPIVSPDVDGIVLNAICPHTLSARPLVVSSDEIIKVIETKAEKVSLLIDGQVDFELLKEDVVKVKKSEKFIKFICIEKDFYQIVREKLKWIEQKKLVVSSL